MALALYYLFKKGYCVLKQESFLMDCAHTDEQKSLLVGFFSAMKSLESSILASRILLWRILGLRSLSRRAAGIWGLWIVFHGPAGLGSLSHLSPCNPTIILSSCVLGALLAGVPTWGPVGDRVCGDPVPAPGTPPALLFVLETEKVLSNSMLRFRKYGAAFIYWKTYILEQ